MKQILSFKDFREWTRKHFTRKWTIWIHVGLGAFCAILYHWFPGLAIVLFTAFACFEYWQANMEGDKGHLDFWDALFGLFIGAGILLILTVTGGLV